MIEFHDLLIATLEEILPYYKSVNKKPVPMETVENLKKLAGQLQQYAGEYNEHVPLETVTDEMRQLAHNIPHYNYPDICLTGKASGISFLLGAIVCDLYETKKLTEDEIQAKSYLSQSMNLLNEFSAKRSCPKDEKEQHQFKTKLSEDIIHFANQLDKNPVIKQYQDFSIILSDTENKADKKTDKSEINSMKQTRETHFQTEKEFREKLELRPVFGQKSTFVRSILNDSVKNRTDVLGILFHIFSPGRFYLEYWERYGLPDLAKDFAELDMNNRIVTLKKTLTKDECNQLIKKVNETFFLWQAWRKRAIAKGIEKIIRLKSDKYGIAWIDWAEKNPDLKSELDDFEIYELREYLEHIAIEIDKRISALNISKGEFETNKEKPQSGSDGDAGKIENDSEANVGEDSFDWSVPMSKQDMMKILRFGVRGYQKLKAFSKQHKIRKVADNRQLWEIRIDNMPKNLRDKFKPAEK